jgi:hypothetical protein
MAYGFTSLPRAVGRLTCSPHARGSEVKPYAIRSLEIRDTEEAMQNVRCKWYREERRGAAALPTLRLRLALFLLLFLLLFSLLCTICILHSALLKRRGAEREAEREQGEAVEWGELTAIPCKITGDSRWGFFLFY